MKIKVIVLLATVAVLHLVLGGLFLAGGCAQEEAPMPPGVYVPPTKDASGNTVAQPKSTAPSTVGPVAGESSISTPSSVEPSGAKEEKHAEKKHIEKTGTEATHKVGKGESLWSISKKYSVTIEELALYNNIPATAKLKIGQTILIPPAGKAVKAPAAKAASAKTHAKAEAKTSSAKPAAKTHSKAPAAAKKAGAKESAPADGSYVIKAGDNFSTLAKKFGVKVSDITAANPGIDSSKLKIGQKINLPGASGAAVAEKTAAKPGAAVAGAAESTAPAAAKTSNVDSLLEDIPNPDAAPAAKPAESAPVASPEAVKAVAPAASAAAPAASGDSDKLEDMADGTGVTVTTGAETTLAKLAVKYKVKEADVKLLNPSIPADGTIKAGMVIKLP